jgi:heavy metal sensor kinase
LRLTLLTVTLVGITLGAIGIVLYVYIEQSSYDQLNNALRERTAEVESSLNRQQLEQIGVVTVQLPGPKRLDAPQIYTQIIDRKGRRRASSDPDPLPASKKEYDDALDGQTTISTMVLTDGSQMRALYTPIVIEGEVFYVLHAATPLAPLDRQLDLVRLVLLATGLLALGLVGFGTWWTTGRMLGAVDRISATARSIERSQDLHQRIPAPPDAPDDEMARLVRTFNSMLARLETAFQAQKQFVADSSHELRSPLTVIRGNLELWRRARNEAERQEVITAIEQETERMTRLVENLLLLAQMEAAPASATATAHREAVELDSLLLTVYRQARVIDNGAHQIVLAHEDAVTVQGQRDQLQQLLLNLVDNAIKYTPPGSTISLGLYGDAGWARLEVADSGPGIPAEDLPHVFDRFYRSDKARSRAQGGAGLGLAIVREVAEAHGGRVEALSAVGQGTLFRVWLPRPADSAPTLDPLAAEWGPPPLLPAAASDPAPLLPGPTGAPTTAAAYLAGTGEEPRRFGG